MMVMVELLTDQTQERTMRPHSSSQTTHQAAHKPVPSAKPVPMPLDPARDADWQALCRLCFPPDLDELARSTGAVQRFRQVDSGALLLRLLLLYIIAGMSLREVAGFAARSGWTDCTDDALRYRFRHAVPLLEAILAVLLVQRVRAPAFAGGKLRIVDATTITRPGQTGSDFRLHVTYDAQAPALCGVQMTDASGGEHLQRGWFGQGDLVMADRGLGLAKDVHEAHQRKAYCLLRVHPPNLPMQVDGGQRLDTQAVMDRADRGLAAVPVLIPYGDKDPVPARLLVLPLAPEVAHRARQRMKQASRKKGHTPDKRALRMAGYLFIVTTLPVEVATDKAVLSWYRVRWQIELFFKRCKGLLGLGKMNKTKEELARVHGLGKMIEAALIDRLVNQEQAQDPLDQLDRRPRSFWRLTHLHAVDLLVVICGHLGLAKLLARSYPALLHLRERPRRRLSAQSVIDQIADSLSRSHSC